MKAWKKRAYAKALEEVVLLEDDGHDVYRYNDWHWRIDGIDVWPSSRKFRKKGSMFCKNYEKLSDIFKK